MMGRRSFSLSFSSFPSPLALPSVTLLTLRSKQRRVGTNHPKFLFLLQLVLRLACRDWRRTGVLPASGLSRRGKKTVRNCLKRVSTPLPVGGKGNGMETTDISNILAFLWVIVNGKNENKQIATTDRLFY